MTASWAFAAFGSLAVIPTELTGGTTVVAGSASALFLVLKVFSTRGGVSGVVTASTGPRLLLLSVFTITAVIGALVLPAVFQGTVDVISMRAAKLEPLAPTSANFTQSAYLMLSFLVAGSYCWLARRPGFVDDFGRATIVGAAVAVLTGLLDIFTDRLGIADTLSIFRTASYAILATGDIEGVKRTIGLMPEASAYGGLLGVFVALFLFTRNVYTPSTRWKLMSLLLVCAALAVLSTSSTAYVELGVTAILFFLQNVHGLLFGAAVHRSRALKEIVLVFFVLSILLLAAMFFDEARETLYRIFDQIILHKTGSSSYIERSFWTRQAFDAWIGTGGLGVGAGSVRTSNLFVNILSSTGFFAFSFFLAFLFKVFTSPSPTQDWRLAELVRGTKLALIPSLVGASLAGTTPDYGSISAAFFGLIVGAATLNRYDLRVQTSEQYSKSRTSGVNKL